MQVAEVKSDEALRRGDEVQLSATAGYWTQITWSVDNPGSFQFN